jgi:hypothetical protein
VVVFTGVDLFTSYCRYSVAALFHRRCSFLELLKTWVFGFFGNLAAGFVSWQSPQHRSSSLLAQLYFRSFYTTDGGTFEIGPYKYEALAFANIKWVTGFAKNFRAKHFERRNSASESSA